LEGKKAEETPPRKSTSRTLKWVGQRYPPVKWTLREGHSIASETRKETQYNNQCLGLWLARKFLDDMRVGSPRNRSWRDIDVTILAQGQIFTPFEPQSGTLFSGA
jgi:hypothetical protein